VVAEVEGQEARLRVAVGVEDLDAGDEERQGLSLDGGAEGVACAAWAPLLVVRRGGVEERHDQLQQLQPQGARAEADAPGRVVAGEVVYVHAQESEAG
jgi:hypothetical protein